MFLTLRLKEIPFKQVYHQIIYIESEYNEAVNRYIQENYETIHDFFESHYIDFIYIPKLIEKLSANDDFKSLLPCSTTNGFGNDFLLQYMFYPEKKKDVLPSFIYYIPGYRDEMCKEVPILYRGVVLTDKAGNFDSLNLQDIYNTIESDCTPKFFYKSRDEDEEDEIFCREGDEDFLFEEELKKYSKDVQEMMLKMKSIANTLKLEGVSEYILEKLIYGDEKLSRLYITKDYRIFLPDYDNVEIELKPLPKILFLFYLNHPEGVSFKDLSDYRDELMGFYKNVVGDKFLRSEAEERINRLTTPWNNSINEKSSVIKSAFKAKMNCRLAQNYYITGGRTEVKKITLPRELVIMGERISETGILIQEGRRNDPL